LVCRKA